MRDSLTAGHPAQLSQAAKYDYNLMLFIIDRAVAHVMRGIS